MAVERRNDQIQAEDRAVTLRPTIQTWAPNCCDWAKSDIHDYDLDRRSSIAKT